MHIKRIADDDPRLTAIAGQLGTVRLAAAFRSIPVPASQPLVWSIHQ